MSIGPCNDAPPVIGSVVFDPATFVTYYPEFASVAAGALTNNFNRATLILSNCCGSAVTDAAKRQILLGMLTAHITALTQGVKGQPAQGVVGRVSSATQGSVNVQTDLGLAPSTSQLKAYLQQTQYGMEFLASTTQYRSAKYFAPPRECFGPQFYGAPWTD